MVCHVVMACNIVIAVMRRTIIECRFWVVSLHDCYVSAHACMYVPMHTPVYGPQDMCLWLGGFCCMLCLFGFCNMFIHACFNLSMYWWYLDVVMVQPLCPVLVNHQPRWASQGAAQVHCNRACSWAFEGLCLAMLPDIWYWHDGVLVRQPHSYYCRASAL